MHALFVALFISSTTLAGNFGTSAREPRRLKLPPAPRTQEELKAFLSDESNYRDSFNWTFRDGTTPLILAAKFEDIELTRGLLNNGVFPLKPHRSIQRGRAKKTGSTPEDDPYLRKKVSIKNGKMLAPRRKSAPDSADVLAPPPYQEAIEEEVVDGEPQEERIALHFAAKNNRADIAFELVNYSHQAAQITSVDQWGYTPIHTAVANNSIETLKILLDGPLGGAEKLDYTVALDTVLTRKRIKKTSSSTVTPILLAALKIKNVITEPERSAQIEASYKMIELLLKAGSNPNTSWGKDDDKNLPWFAKSEGLDKIYCLLVAKGGDANWGGPAIHQLQKTINQPTEEFLIFLRQAPLTWSTDKIVKAFHKAQRKRAQTEKKQHTKPASARGDNTNLRTSFRSLITTRKKI